jgi:hypothetical protein
MTGRWTMDREEVSGLVGRKVAVRLNSFEARGLELVATLDEAREDGIVLSEIGELGQGPTLFCPWESLHRVRDRPPWLAPPHEVSEEGQQGWESYELREASEEDVAPEPLPERREPSARTLERVVPVAQRVTVDGVTVAIASLELYGEGLGVLRWQVSFMEEALRRDPDPWFGIPEPKFEISDGNGRTLPWSPRRGGSSDGEADGDVLVADLPDAGDLEVEVPRVVYDAYEDGEYRGDGPSFEGSWVFRFTL